MIIIYRYSNYTYKYIFCKINSILPTNSKYDIYFNLQNVSKELALFYFYRNYDKYLLAVNIIIYKINYFYQTKLMKVNVNRCDKDRYYFGSVLEACMQLIGDRICILIALNILLK